MNSIKPIKNYQTTLQFNMNTAAYQNDQVDWGLLAKQWIQMAELVPAATSRPIYTEKGEAPMEIEKDDELQTLPVSSTDAAWNAGWNQSFPNQGQWRQGWNTWTNRNTVPAIHQLRPPLLPQPNSFPTFNTTNISSPDYWAHKPRFPVTEVQSSKENDLRSEIIENEEDLDEDTTQTIDAAKRKILPAWLREGLEKMEREKQKQEEKEKETRERELALRQRRIEEEEALKELEKDSLIPTKSKFESDSDDIDEELEKKVPAKELKLKFEQNMGKKDKPEEKKQSKSPELYRTREEIIQDLMLSVRKNLTEILLEVTNEEILELAKESLTKARKKAPTAQALRKTALTSLTGGLGLGIYANSTDESDSSSDETPPGTSGKPNNNDDDDSEQELQELIKRRKAAFEKTSREIEAQIAEEDEREERRRREREKDNHGNEEKIDDDGRRRNHHGGSGSSGVGGVSNDYRDGETQLHDKNSMKYGRSAREKKPTRFSDPRDTVKNVQTHVSIVTPNKSTYKNENDNKTTINSYNRRSCDTSNSSSEHSPINSRLKKTKKNKKSSHKRKRTKYENSDNSDDSTNDDNRSVFSSASHKLLDTKTRRSRSRDHYSRSEDSRSSYNRRDRSRSRSRNREQQHHHRHKRETTRDYYDDRSRSQDKKRKTKSRSKERYFNKNNNKDRSVSRSKDRHSSSSSRHRY